MIVKEERENKFVVYKMGEPLIKEGNETIRVPSQGIPDTYFKNHSDAELAELKLFRVTPFIVPSGKQVVSGTTPTYTRDQDGVKEIREIENIPTPPSRTIQEKVALLSQEYGLTVEELKTVIGGR